MTRVPLDLRAVEERMKSTLGEEQALAPDVQALLVILRAHREALAPLAKARYADPVSVEFGLVKGVDMLRAQAVLASVVDTPSVRVGDRETPP